ncbi:MAG: transcriptional regulator MraZ, partial [Sphingomonadales bacterium]|nr:transcriptional regulator MraZ [Sphingomonadales bacterium]
GRGYARNLYEEMERRRLAEEGRGGTLEEHYARARRAFGMTEDVPYDTSGRIVLPPMMRRKGGIDELALFVGVGGTVEIWNPRTALKEGDRDLKEIAAYRLEEKGLTA